MLKLAGTRCLILSDCEGYETELFTPEVVEALRTSDLIIELHGDARAMLEPRFKHTHFLEFVGMTPRDPRKFPHLASLEPEDARRAIDEGARGEHQEWMLATARRFCVDKSSFWEDSTTSEAPEQNQGSQCLAPQASDSPNLPGRAARYPGRNLTTRGSCFKGW